MQNAPPPDYERYLEDEQLAAVRRYRLLDTSTDAALDRLTAMASRIFHVPYAAICFVDQDHIRFKSFHGLSLAGAAHHDSFCKWITRGDAVFVVRDAFRDRRFRDNPAVVGPPEIRAYAGAPLLTPEGTVVGTLCLMDTKPRTFSAAKQALLMDMAAVVMREIEMHRVIQEADHDDPGLWNIDPLTGLLNHRAFHRRFQEEVQRTRLSAGPLALLLLDLDNFRLFNDAYGHTAGDDVLRRVADALRDTAQEKDSVAAARFGGDEFAVLLPSASPGAADAFTHALSVRLGRLEYRPPGHDTAIPLVLSAGTALLPDDGPTRQHLLGAAGARLLRAKTGGDLAAPGAYLRRALAGTVEGFSMLDALVTAVDNKDRYTRRHSEDVLFHSLKIAERLGFSEQERHTVAVAALLHDVGKIGVPDAVLRKPGRLTDAEFEAVKQHPQMGAVIVTAVPGFEGTLDAVRHHHERWDGGGYPFGLRGEETPLIARLLGVADAYSAMTTDRPYRKGMEGGQAQAILAAGAGTQWDPECVEAFLGSFASETGSIY